MLKQPTLKIEPLVLNALWLNIVMNGEAQQGSLPPYSPMFDHLFLLVCLKTNSLKMSIVPSYEV